MFIHTVLFWLRDNLTQAEKGKECAPLWNKVLIYDAE